MVIVAALLLLAPSPAPSPADTLRLADVRAAAAARDPRAVQPALLARATDLRLASLAAEARPQVAVLAQGTLQSDAPTIPITLPDGSRPASPPLAQVRALAEAEWSVLDGGRRARRADVERARLAEGVAGVAVTLQAVRDAATDAFFAALLHGARADALALGVRDLDARLAVLRVRVAEGAALAADAGAVEAETIRLRQAEAEARADRSAALAVLADLTGADLTPDVVLAVPDVGPVPAARGPRAEFERLAAVEARAEAEARLAASAARPAVSVFGQAGVGRPSPLDVLGDDLKPFAVGGVRLRWPVLDGGRARLDADAARVQAEIARTEADALDARIRRETAADRATLARLAGAGADDDRAVALREEALRVAARQLDEGVILADAYTDRLTDLADARLTRERHRIERARAYARLLSALGCFPDLP